jgi:glycosyltransferase involved in cell wall biosynthesis
MASVAVVIPVLNEEKVLERSVRALHHFLSEQIHQEWRIIVADNGSTDQTFEIAKRLSVELPGVQADHIPEAGRGRALSRTWLASEADVVAYMDVDLSTGLEAFPRLLTPILEGRADLAAGSRLSRGAETTRSLKREVLSRGFVLLINVLFRAHLEDTQCGFKAVSKECARKLLPFIEDKGWFWDTELLLLAAKGGWRLIFVPVRWVEDTDSRVKVASTVWRDIKGLMRMRGFDWSKVRRTA